jgi:hypothetical protein
MQMAGSRDADTSRRLAALEKAGHPVLRISLRHKLDIGREFFRWEIATAVACSVIGVNSFDEPNVSESKANSIRLLTALTSGSLQKRKPLVSDAGVRAYGTLPEASGPKTSQGQLTMPRILSAQFRRLKPGAYVAILAYLTPSPANDRLLQRLRTTIADGLAVATSVGYGPRYLHSTGQYHKGGPATGCFLILSDRSRRRVGVPRQRYGFETLIRAQALGDLEAIESRQLPALHFDLSAAGDAAGLRLLTRWARVAVAKK